VTLLLRVITRQIKIRAHLAWFVFMFLGLGEVFSLEGEIILIERIALFVSIVHVDQFASHHGRFR
jgi:dolichyl-phosphate-mannose--protein O-mannosyl transferase